MLCPKCNRELYKEEIVDKVNKRIDNTYIFIVRISYSCFDCEYFRLEYTKHELDVNI